MPFLTVDGTRLFFEETGSGDLAVFVHGGGLDHTMWNDQLASLGDTRRCVAMDLPNHGRSGAGRLDLPKAVRALGHRAVDLVGHSWGGHEVMAVWWRAPSVVRSIALFGVMFSSDAPPRAVSSSAQAPQRPVPMDAQEKVVRSINVPFLVATGSDDTNTPAHLCHRLSSFNPSARWLEIPHAGHMSPVEQPEAVNGALRSLWYDLSLERRST